MYEKGLLEVKTDQKRTILAKKSVFRTSGGKPDQSISSAFLPAKSLLVPKPKPYETALNHALSLTFLLKQLAGGGGILYS